VEGASTAPGREHDPAFVGGLPGWRATAETLNGTLPPRDGAALPEVVPAPPVEEAVGRLTADCARITLLAIGLWTSFLRYADRIIARVGAVVAQGSPYPDDEVRGESDGWNCRYDWAACREAFVLLGRRRLRADWVDIPQGERSCGWAEPGRNAGGERVFAFTPNVEMARALAPDGLSGRSGGHLEPLRACRTGARDAGGGGVGPAGPRRALSGGAGPSASRPPRLAGTRRTRRESWPACGSDGPDGYGPQPVLLRVRGASVNPATAANPRCRLASARSRPRSRWICLRSRRARGI